MVNLETLLPRRQCCKKNDYIWESVHCVGDSVGGSFQKEKNQPLGWLIYSIMAEAYRSRTCLRHHCRTLVLKTKRHTGDETLPDLFTFTNERPEHATGTVLIAIWPLSNVGRECVIWSECIACLGGVWQARIAVATSIKDALYFLEAGMDWSC